MLDSSEFQKSEFVGNNYTSTNKNKQLKLTNSTINLQSKNNTGSNLDNFKSSHNLKGGHESSNTFFSKMKKWFLQEILCFLLGVEKFLRVITSKC